MLLQNNYRCVFPNLLYGEEARFEASTYLDTRGDKHRTVRGAWQPFFFSGRSVSAACSHAPSGTCLLMFPLPSNLQITRFADTVWTPPACPVL